jgi:hypothetical protein
MDGSKYVGEFAGGKFNGRVALTYANGKKASKVISQTESLMAFRLTKQMDYP